MGSGEEAPAAAFGHGDDSDDRAEMTRNLSRHEGEEAWRRRLLDGVDDDWKEMTRKLSGQEGEWGWIRTKSHSAGT